MNSVTCCWTTTVDHWSGDSINLKLFYISLYVVTSQIKSIVIYYLNVLCAGIPRLALLRPLHVKNVKQFRRLLLKDTFSNKSGSGTRTPVAVCVSCVAFAAFAGVSLLYSHFPVDSATSVPYVSVAFSCAAPTLCLCWGGKWRPQTWLMCD